MRTKRFAVILVAIVFVLVMLFSCIALFTVRKVSVSFAVGDNTDTATVQKELDKFLGKSLLFLNTEDVKNSVADFYYMEVISVNKRFPNVVNVEIVERKEIYDVVYQDRVFVTTENGFVLRAHALDEQTFSRDRIMLELNGVNVTDGALGKTISTDGDELMQKVFEMAKSVHLTNCIKSVELEMATEKQNATFYTYTGVKIIVREILDDGVKKIEQAFKKYDEDATDFEKTFRTIEAIKLNSGEIQAVWTNS